MVRGNWLADSHPATAARSQFDGRHFDALHIDESFGQSLRNEVDHDTMSRNLVLEVEQTLAPADVCVWIPSERRS
ncbi:MAG: hypothetical protein LH645_07365 [Actinomycetia bacterium]|nr:hypothetical protein [Actinomycetes bacterium]